MPDTITFQTTIELHGKTATGFQVPEDVVTRLGGGKRPAVRVTINGHTYRSTVAPMGGANYLPLSAENRVAAGLAAGDTITVTLERDTAPREVEVPADFAAAPEADPAARATFERASYSKKRWHILSIEGTKNPETRQRRIERSVATLRDGRVQG